MFSVNDIMSFYKMEQEVENARPSIEHEKDFVWIVVGNKSDLDRDPYITDERIEAFCATLGTTPLWLYISVKTGENVDRVLEVVAMEIHRVRHSTMSTSAEEQTVNITSLEHNHQDDIQQPDKKGCKPHNLNNNCTTS